MGAPRKGLALTDGTVKGRAVGLHDAADMTLTTPPRARLSFAIIDGKSVLEIPRPAVGSNIVAQRRAAGLDCLLENRLDRVREVARPLEAKPARRASRREPGSVKRLAGIDIADAGDDSLIHERGLERRA